METATEIYTEVAVIIQDTSFDVDDTISYINKGIKEIAGLVLLPKLLETENTVETYVGEAYTELPDDFMKSLHFCYSDDHSRQIKIYADIRLLYRQFSQLDQGGVVVGVAVRGNDLCYQRIPSSVESLRIHYYKYPTVLTTGDDTPDCLPDFLVRPLMVNYVCKEIFSLIEDGIDGAKVNTTYHEGKFAEAMGQLAAYIGPENREPQYINDDMDLDGYL